MKRFLMCAGVVGMAVAGMSQGAQADPLTLYGGPDLAAFDLTVTYQYSTPGVAGGTGTFSVTGSVLDFDDWAEYPSNTNHSSTLNTYSTSNGGGTFSLTAVFTATDATHLVVQSGLLTVNAAATPLFQSTSLVNFGYTAGTDAWQFEFANGTGPTGTGRLIAVDVLGGGNTNYSTYKVGGDKKYMDNITFLQDFADTAEAGAADTFEVAPLPRAAYLALGVPMIVLLRRRVRLQVV